MSKEQLPTTKEHSVIQKLAEKAACTMSQDGELPSFKVRGQCRICEVARVGPSSPTEDDRGSR